MKNKIISISLVFLLVALSISLVSAEFWSCFDRGEVYSFCNPEVNYNRCNNYDRCTCDSNRCDFCMKNYNETENCYNQGPWNVCLGVPRECSSVGNATIDGEAPNLTINSPLQGNYYTSRSVLLDIELDERANIYYLDNINGRGKWRRICSKCYRYNRVRRFKEGFNDLTFRAKDIVGNEVYKNVSFSVDSREPRIRRTEPRRGFASGTFDVQFSEENPVSLMLYYGSVNPGQDSKELDIQEDCYIEKSRYYCSTYVDLEEYDGEEIEYYFVLEDVAGNIDESRPYELEVDTSPPVLNNPNEFWEQGEGRYQKYIYFDFDITEKNFDEVSYYDYEENKPRWRRLCSRLRDGRCKKRKSFRRGLHVLDIQITDEAGNAISIDSTERVEFEVV